MTEDDEVGSLAEQAAAWIPPWQRASAAAAQPETGADDRPEDGGDEPEDEQRPETDRLTIATETSAAEGQLAEIQSAEIQLAEIQSADGRGTDSRETEGLAAEGTGAEGMTADEPAVDEPDEEESEAEQQPETDRLTEGADVAGVTLGVLLGVGGGDDEDDDPQRPETDRLVETAPSAGRPENLEAAIEAIMMVVDVPVGADSVAEVLGVPESEVTAALQRLSAQYTAEGRGFDLRRAAGGWRVYSRAEYAPFVERFVLDGQSVRLTQAALETLAFVAYLQPVTRARMSAIRGVNCDGVVRTLGTRGLIEECGTQPESGAFLYRTTPLFLEKLGLDSLDQLPPLAPFLPDDVNGLIDA